MRLEHDFFYPNPSDNKKGTNSQGTAKEKENREHEDEEMGLKSEGNEYEETGVSYIASPFILSVIELVDFMDSMVNMPLSTPNKLIPISFVYFLSWRKLLVFYHLPSSSRSSLERIQNTLCPPKKVIEKFKLFPEV